MTKLIPIYAPSQKPSGHVIFVHGLGGDALETWGFNKEVSWGTWISNKRPDVKIWSLAYEIEPVAWTGASMPLFDRAINVLALLKSHEVFSEPIVFICHSMGGLLVKEILRNAKTTSAKEYNETVKNVKAIGFIATPHAGSNLADFAEYLQLVLRLTISVSELKSGGAQLRQLNVWFRNNYAELGLIAAVFFETRPTPIKKRIVFGLLPLGWIRAQIVDATSADPGIPGITPIGLDADHIEICKPSENDIVVGTIFVLINKALAPPTDNSEVSALTRRYIAANSLDELRVVENEIYVLAQKQDDGRVRNLKDQVQRALRRQRHLELHLPDARRHIAFSRGRRSPAFSVLIAFIFVAIAYFYGQGIYHLITASILSLITFLKAWI